MRNETNWQAVVQAAAQGAFCDCIIAVPGDEVLRGPLEKVTLSDTHVTLSLRWVAHVGGLGEGYEWTRSHAPNFRFELGRAPWYGEQGILLFLPTERAFFQEVILHPRFDVRAVLAHQRRGTQPLMPGDVTGDFTDAEARWSCARLCGLDPGLSWETIAAQAKSLRLQNYISSDEERYILQRARRAA